MNSTETLPPLVVRADLAGLRSRARTMIVLSSVLLAAALALAAAVLLAGTGALQFTGLAMLMLATCSTIQIALHSYHLGARTAVSEPLRLTSWGLEAHGAQGTVRLPWQAVARIETHARLGQRFLLVRPQEWATLGQHGVEVEAARWRSIHRRGVVIEQRGLLAPLDQILSAASALSGGRVQIG